MAPGVLCLGRGGRGVTVTMAMCARPIESTTGA